MKTIRIYIFIILYLTSCDSDDPILNNSIVGGPPLSFDLLEVPPNATNVSLNPILSWESAKNPSAGEVTYDLYLGAESNPTNLIEGDIEDTSFKLSERLSLLTKYYWKVVAKDIDGKTSQSAIHQFTTRYFNLAETPVASSTDFSPRLGHTTAAFNNKMWVFGGRDTDDFSKNDVWSSSDGIAWTQTSTSMPFAEQAHHSTAVFDNKLWVIAGGNIFSSSSKSSIWQSDDGSNWEAATLDAPFSARSSHSTVVFNNKIWVIGGFGLNGFNNDVWHSSDGENWTEVTPTAKFSARSGHSSVVFDNKIWVIGGRVEFNQFVNDVWFSSDGVQWTEATAAASFAQRSDHKTEVFDNKIWIIGGRGSQDGNIKNDIWYSSDGVSWTEAGTSSMFSERWGHTTTVFDDKLWIIGGGDYTKPKNDVWVLE